MKISRRSEWRRRERRDRIEPERLRFVARLLKERDEATPHLGGLHHRYERRATWLSQHAANSRPAGAAAPFLAVADELLQALSGIDFGRVRLRDSRLPAADYNTSPLYSWDPG